MNLPRIPALALLGFFYVLSGCSHSGEIKVVAIEGKVIYRDKPIEEAQVVFHPVDTTLTLPHRPMGITDSEGVFRLTTFNQDDGAPIGQYVITVKQLDLALVGEDLVRSGKNLLPPSYGELGTSPLRYQVRDKNNAPADCILLHK